jgi:hypothetical protein
VVYFTNPLFLGFLLHKNLYLLHFCSCYDH